MDEQNPKTTKVKKTTRIFISYKTGAEDGLTYNANSIRRELENRDYDVWMDDVSLDAGRNWNEQIYENAANSDILLLVLANTTANSDWVRREVDVAKGAQVFILPVLVRDNFNKQEMLEKFDLPRTQYVDVTKGTDEQFKKLFEEIGKWERETINKQVKWLRQREQKVKGDPAEPNQSIAIYKFKPKHKINFPSVEECRIHISTGDIFKMPPYVVDGERKQYDVLVNSENEYMQMARIFESKTVSALIRYHGSWLDSVGHLKEDTVQDELNALLIKDEKIDRPVGLGSVFVTNAGHQDSELIKKFRYVFHTATVYVKGTDTEKRLIAAEGAEITKCVVNTLEKVWEINENKAEKVANQKPESYKNIETIIFPLFASGHGGLPASDVMKPIAEGIRRFLNQAEENGKPITLKHIYVNVYYKQDIDEMKKVLGDMFTDVTPTESKEAES